MKVAVLGSGLMGSVIAEDLARSEDVDQVIACDVDKGRLDALGRRISSPNLSTQVVDVKDTERVVRFLRDFDVAVGALPHGFILDADRAAIEAGVNMVDVAFEDEQMDLDRLAKAKGVALIPGCGLAPGLSNILLAYAARRFSKAEAGHIWVGGLPRNPKPPLGYRLLFSVHGLLREYLRPARIVRDGRITEVQPFDSIDEIELPEPIGRCEAFYTDGLGTLLYTVRGLRELDERTIRWRGHGERIKFLKEAGFFEYSPIRVDDISVSPVKLSAIILEKLLNQGEPDDITVMKIEVSGTIDGRKERITYELLDFYDKVNGVSSMARTTGYTCSIICRMIARREIRNSGVVGPEIALDDNMVRKLLSELLKRGVRVEERRTSE